MASMNGWGHPRSCISLKMLQGILSYYNGKQIPLTVYLISSPTFFQLYGILCSIASPCENFPAH